MHNELIWQHLDTAGWEHVRVSDDHPGWNVFDSILVREHQSQILRGGYTLVTDKNWRTLELRLMVETAPGSMEGIHLLTEGDGKWTDANENPMPELDGCLDVDIQWSPLTNSLPVNRIPLEVGAAQEILVAYVSLPELTVKPVKQRYSRTTQTVVGYTSPSLPGGADLVVDQYGLVEHYPQRFIRNWPSHT